MVNIEETLLNFCQQLSKKNILIAYSGGVDSHVLLHALATLKNQNKISQELSACHVNHGLSDNAQYWQQFTTDQCLLYKVSYHTEQVEINVKAKQSLEALARDARYSVLKKHCDNNTVVVTGHHCDDQSETLLLALKRGAGTKGLSAMLAQTTNQSFTLARPLLVISRQQIVDYAQKQQLTWIEDESNQDSAFDRNFLRNQVIPLLTARWPSINKTINRSAQHCQEAQVLLDELAEIDLQQAHSDNSLDLNVLLTLSQARFNNLIRYYLAQRNLLMPATEQLTALFTQLNSSIDKNPEVKLAQVWCRRYKNKLFFTTDFDDISHILIKLPAINEINNERVTLPNNLGFITMSVSKNTMCLLFNGQEQRVLIAKDSQQMTIRFSHNNERCLPDYRKHHRPMKKVLQEINLPPWQRKRIPFLYYGEELVAAVGYFVCQPYLPK